MNQRTDPTNDDRSPLALGVAWASRIMALAIEMVVPGLLGWWVDSYLGTRVVFMILGFMLGMGLGFWHLLWLASNAAKRPPGARSNDDGRNDAQQP